MLSLRDVLPHVHFGPVRQREDPEVLVQSALAAVEQVPQLGPLALGIPLAEAVAVAEEALLGPRLLLVAASAAEAPRRPSSRAAASSSVTVCSAFRLGFVPVSSLHPPRLDGLLHVGDPAAPRPPRPRARPGTPMVSGKLCPVSMCRSGNGIGAGQKAFRARCTMTMRVLAAGEQENGPLELRGRLPHDEDRLALQLVEMAAAVAAARVLAGRRIGFHRHVLLRRLSSECPEYEERRGVCVRMITRVSGAPSRA